MNKLFKNLVVHPLLALLLVIVLLVVAVIVLSVTQVGTNVLAGVAERAVPALAMNGVRGSLYNQLEVESLVWEKDGIKVDAQQAVFKPTADTRLPVKVNIQQLTAKRLVVDLPPSVDTPYEPLIIPDLRLPVNAEIANVTLDELVINQGETVIKLQDVTLKAHTRSDKLYLTELQGSLAGDLGRMFISGSGEMGLESPNPLQVSLDVDSTSKKLGSGLLALEARGELQDYQVELKGDWKYGEYPRYKVDVLAQGNFEGMQLDKVSLQGDAGEIAAQGRMTWSPDLTWDIQASADQLRPGIISPDAEGELDVVFLTKGSLADEPEIRLQLDQLEGTVRDYPVDVALFAELSGEDLMLHMLNAKVGDNKLWARSEEDNQLDVNWKIDAPDLSQFHPEVSGGLKGDGHLSGKVDGSQFDLRINKLLGEVVGYPVMAEGGLSLKDQVVSTNKLDVKVANNQLTLDGVADEDQGIDWTLDAAELDKLHPELSGQLKGEGNAKGLLDGSRLALRVDALEGKVREYPVKASGALRLEGQLLTAQKVRVDVGGNTVALDGKTDEDRGIDWRVDAKNLVALHPELDGKLKGHGNAKGLLDGSRWAVRIAALEGRVKDYPLKAQGKLQLENKVISADKVRLDVGKNKLRLDGKADEDTGVDWIIDAPELATLHPEISGHLRGRGNAKGLLDGSRVALKVDELNGKVKEFPVSARGELKLDDQLISAKRFQVKVGKNKVRLDGVADEVSGLDWVVDAPELGKLHPALKGNLRGHGNAKGQLDGSQVSVKIANLTGKIQDYPLKAEGELKLVDQLISAKKFRLSVGKNKVRLDGAADEATGIDWVIDAPELATLHPELTGNVKGSGNAKGLLDGSRASVRVDKLSGQIKGYPLTAQGEVRLKDQLISANNFRLGVGKNKIRLNGVADEQAGIDWELDAPDLVALHPDVAGSLKGRGNVKGLLDGSRFSLNVGQLQGRVKGYPVSAKGEVSLRNQLITANNFRLIAGKNAVSLNGVADERTGIDWQLNAPDLASLHPEIAGNLKGRGNVKGLLDGSRASLQIAQLQGRVKGFPLQVTGGVRLRDKQVSADKLRVNMGGNNVLLDGVADERTGINWSVNAPKLAAISPDLQGHLKGSGNLKGLMDGSRASVSINRLEGRVKGYPVNASGGVRFNNNVLSANDLRVNVGANAMRLNGVVDDKTGLAWQLDAQKLVQLHPSIDGQLKGRGNVMGKLDGSLITVNLAGLQGRVRGFPVNAVGTVQLRDKKLLSVNNLRATIGQNQVRLDGQLNETRGINWQLDAKNLTQISPQVKGSLRGNGNIRGVLDGSSFSARINVLEGRVNQYPLRVSGQVSRKGEVFTARNVLLNAGQNTLKVNGSASDGVNLNWQLDARNLSQIKTDLKGSVKGNGTLTGKIDGSQLNLQIARLQGQVDGRPLQAKGAVSVAGKGKHINLSNLQVNAGSNLVSLNGQASNPLNLSWKINGRNLAQAWPGLAGSLQGEGTVRGNTSRPQLQGYLKGGNLRYQDMAVQALDVTIAQNGANYDVKGTARNLRQGENIVTYVDFKGQGTPQRHTAVLAAVHKDGKLNVNLSGGLQGETWNGAVNSLGLRDTVAGDWQLASPIRISASPKVVTVTNACLTNKQNARLCSQAGWTAKGGAVAKGSLQQVPMSMARAFLPKNIQLPGRINADYEFQQRNGRPYARVNVQLPDNSITIRNGRKRPETFQYTNARANVVLNDRNATVDAQLDIRGHGQVRTKGNIILSPENQQHRVDLRTSINVPSITWLQRFSPQVSALKGQVTGDVRVTGLLNKPQVTGVARLQNASLYLPETGSKIDDINLTAQANGPDQLAINGTLRAGSGQLTANGTLRLANLPDWSGDIRLQGENLLLMNSHEIQAKVSPDIYVKATSKSVAITGTIRIPETTVSLRELPTGASVRSDDIVIVGRETKKPQGGNKVVIAQDSGKPLYIQPNVVIELGDKVTFSGFGFDARLKGKMRLLRNRQGVVAEGALNVVDGIYKAYGQNLRVDRGRLLFNGPVENPGLDVRASRTVEDDIVVGIELGGTVKVPVSSLFSNPLQTQTDTLSYLLTGQSISNISGGQSAILTQAVTSLGVAGGESLAQKLGGQLGLDNVGLNAKGGDYKQSELSLGKRLGPKLYVKYIVGLFDSLQKVAVTYQLNKRLEIEATSGVQQSIDLIYKIDTDRGPFGQ